VSDRLLGIDCGSTVTKAALFDLDGRELASRSRRTGTVNLANGGVERSPDGLWTSVVESFRSVISETATDPRSVAAIGCAGHGNGLYALDARGQALPTAYQSLDERAESIVREWAAAGALDSLQEDAWQRLWAGQPLPILAWLQRYEPATYERKIGRGLVMFW
jgi:L-xylulokinase